MIRWVILLVALAGLMAMHGLSDHGLGGAGVDARMGGVMAAVGTGHVDGTPGLGSADISTGHAGHAGHASAVDHIDPLFTGAGTASLREQHGDHRGGHGDLMVGMCLAVLGALLLFGARKRGSPPLARVLTASVDRTRANATALRARSRGAVRPDLRMLSIQRC
jgi:hypothetical protein